MKTAPLLLESSNLSKTYAEMPAVQNVSLTLDSGESVGLLGPSVCGNSTLILLIAGL